ncbi:MAG: TVP38/TMEM64 family protein [Acutalibacteraceae bacterium]
MSTQNEERHLTTKQKKIISVILLVLFLGFSALVAWFIGKPMISLVSEPEKFRGWVESRGNWGRLIFIGMMVFQVIIALVPGEPLEIGAGYAFGAVEGTLLCVAGVTIGSLLVFGLVRRFGIRLVEVFFDTGKIKQLKFLQNEKRLDLITFIVFFLPGTPKDLLTYFVGLTDIKLSKFILIVSIARLPSIITSTVGGSALGIGRYELAAIVFGGTVIISLLGLFIYNKICIHRAKKNNS